jgi:transposase
MSQVTLLTGPERRRRWPEEERRKIVTAAFGAGASVAAVARQYDVATSLIYKWRQQSLPAHNIGLSFTPAVVVDKPTRLPDKVGSDGGTSISVTLPDGTRVGIGAAVSASLVTAILRALR